MPPHEEGGGGQEREGEGQRTGASRIDPKTPLGFVTVATGADQFDLERRLLAVYEVLYRCPFNDTRNYVLEGLYQVKH